MSLYEPPPYLERGSKGPIVDKLLVFLTQWAKKNRRGETGIVEDGVLGNKGVHWLTEYQKASGLEPDGGCGPQTRAQLLKDGFDFNEEAQNTDGKVSGYVQLDGTTLYWVSGIQATEDVDLALRRALKAYFGN